MSGHMYVIFVVEGQDAGQFYTGAGLDYATPDIRRAEVFTLTQIESWNLVVEGETAVKIKTDPDEFCDFGWVIQMKRNHVDAGEFYVRNGLPGYSVKNVRDARVYATRKEARLLTTGFKNEVVRKVALDYEGRPVMIVPGR